MKMSENNKGKILSEETKMKISESQIGKKRGPMSEETKLKISNANKGKPKSEEAKKKMSDAKKGKPISEEHKENIIKAQKIQREKRKELECQANLREIVESEE